MINRNRLQDMVSINGVKMTYLLSPDQPSQPSVATFLNWNFIKSRINSLLGNNIFYSIHLENSEPFLCRNSIKFDL